MPDNCFVPMWCKTGYRVDADGRTVTYHCLSIKDPLKLKLTLQHVKIDLGENWIARKVESR